MTPEEVSQSDPSLRKLFSCSPNSDDPAAKWQVRTCQRLPNFILRGPSLHRLLYARETGQIGGYLSTRIKYQKPLKAMLLKEADEEHEPPRSERHRLQQLYPYSTASFLGLSQDTRYLYAVQWVRNDQFLQQNGLEMIDDDLLENIGSPLVRIREVTIFEVTPEFIKPIMKFPTGCSLDSICTQICMTDVKIAVGDPKRCIVFNVPWQNMMPHLYQYDPMGHARTMSCSLNYVDLRQRYHVRCVLAFSLSRVKWLNYDDSGQKQFLVISDGVVINRNNVISILSLKVHPNEPIEYEQYNSMTGIRVWKTGGFPHTSQEDPPSPDFPFHYAAIGDNFMHSVEVCNIDAETEHSIAEPCPIIELKHPQSNATYLIESCLDIERCVDSFARSTFQQYNMRYLQHFHYDVNIVNAQRTAVQVVIAATVEVSNYHNSMYCLFTFDAKWCANGGLSFSLLNLAQIDPRIVIRDNLLTHVIAKETERYRKSSPSQICHNNRREVAMGPRLCHLDGEFEGKAFRLTL